MAKLSKPSAAPADQAESPIYIAINMSKVANREESFRQMQEVGPRVCITTASHPGFVGFQAMHQTGIMPLAGRYGAAALHMEKQLNPIRNYQYTMWKDWKDHDEFHVQQFDRVFELCGHCLSMVVEGPWEPVYRIVRSRMPAAVAGSAAAQVPPTRCVALAEHVVKPGREGDFERGAADTWDALAQSPGFMGYMILRQIGVCAIGSFMLDPTSMGEALETLGAHPPRNPKPAFNTLEACPSPPEYLIHSEWAAPEMAQIGMAKVLVNHRVRQVHDEGVMAHLVRGPYIMFFQPMMEEPGWRTML